MSIEIICRGLHRHSYIVRLYVSGGWTICIVGQCTITGEAEHSSIVVLSVIPRAYIVTMYTCLKAN